MSIVSMNSDIRPPELEAIRFPFVVSVAVSETVSATVTVSVPHLFPFQILSSRFGENSKSGKENMMLKNFKTYQIALKLNRETLKLKLPYYLGDQLRRASSSTVLNIAEGSGKITKKDQQKFYAIALGSLREVQAIMDIQMIKNKDLASLADRLGACLYKLCHR